MGTIIQLIGITALAGLSIYAYHLSTQKYSDTFLLSGQHALLSLAVLAGSLSVLRFLVIFNVIGIGVYLNISGVGLIIMLGWLLIEAGRGK